MGAGAVLALLLASQAGAFVRYDNYRGNQGVPGTPVTPNYTNYVAGNSAQGFANMQNFVAGGAGNIASSGTGTNIDWGSTSHQLCDNRTAPSGGNPSGPACVQQLMGRVVYALVKFPAAGTYTFSAAHDDQVKLDFSTVFTAADAPNYRDFYYNVPVGAVGDYSSSVDDFQSFPNSFVVSQAGTCYAMRLHWNNTTNLNFLRLRWSGPAGVGTQIIPAAQLFDPGDPASYESCATVNTDLAIHKAVSSPTFAASTGAGNNTFTYTVTVWNKGPTAIANAVFADTLPAGLVAGSGTGTPTWSCTAYNATGGTIPAGTANVSITNNGLVYAVTMGGSLAVNSSTATPPTTNARLVCTTSVRYPSSAATVYGLTNTATLTVNDLDPSNNTSSATNVRSDVVTVTKTGPATAVQGTQFQYGLVVANNSGATRNGVVVRDQLPPNVMVTGASVSAGTVGCTPLNTAGALLTCTMNTGTPNFTNGSTRTITLNAVASSAGSVINYAATNPGGTGNPSTNPGLSCNPANTSCTQWQTTVNAPTYTVTATVNDPAGGTVTATCTPSPVPTGTPSTCSVTGTTPGWTFTGWTSASGGVTCTNAPQPAATCTVAPNGANVVMRANFSPNPGTLTVTKQITGGATFGTATSYPFTVSCQNPTATYNGTATVAANAGTGTGTVDIPAGSTGCQITETVASRPAAPTNYSWGAPTYTQPAQTAMAPGGTASGVITNPLARNMVPVTITKIIAGATGSSPTGSYGFSLSCDVGGPYTGTIPAATGTATVNVPQGATCNLLDETSTATLNPPYQWGAVSTSAPGLIGASGNSGSITNTVLTPRLAVTKSAPTIAGSGPQYTATYTLTVTNNTGSDLAAGTYTLTDTPAFGGSATLDSMDVTTIGGTLGGGAFPRANPANGTAQQISGSDVSIAANATHTYEVAITFTMTGVTDLTCGGANTGTHNTASITGTGVTTGSASVCGNLPNAANTVTLAKAWINGQSGDTVTLAIGGALSTTGGSSTVGGTPVDATASALAGATVTLSESWTTGDASNYTTAYACSTTAGAVTMSGDSFTMPTAAVDCTVTNTAIPKVTATKVAVPGTLVVGAASQGYQIAVTVANGPTTAPIAVTDTLPTGITLAGAPTVSGGATLSGCNSSGGGLGASCQLAAGLANGAYTITVPISVAGAAAGPTGGNNTANLSGGGDPACTAAPGEACDPGTPDVPVNMIYPVTASAVSDVPSATLPAGTTASCTPSPVVSGAPSTCTYSSVPAGWTFNGWTGNATCSGGDTSASCVVTPNGAAVAMVAHFSPNPGTLTVSKTVTGGPSPLPSLSFPFSVSCTGGTAPTAGFSASGSVAAGGSTPVGNIPYGSTCTVSEGTKPTVTNYTWGTETITNPTGAMTAGGSLTATIANTLARTMVNVTISKTLAGAVPTGGLPAGSYGFTLTCDTGAAYSGTIAVAAGATTGSTTVSVPEGATCSALAETSKPTLATPLQWSTTVGTTPPSGAIQSGSSGSITNTVLTPRLAVLKSAPTIALVSGTQYTATYTVTVSNTGSDLADGTYTLTDTPTFGSSATLNGMNVTTTDGMLGGGAFPRADPDNGTPQQISANNVPIGAGATHTYTVTITFTMTGTAGLTCSASDGPGNGAYNAAGIAGTGVTTGTSSACEDLPNVLKVTATKVAVPGTLVVGAASQGYQIAVTVANGPTTAPIAVTDTLPTGITLAGAPTVSGGATLSGCNSSGGGLGASCQLATGLANGTYTITVPISVAGAAAGPTGGNNTANLSGGGDPACTAAPGEACDPGTPDVPVNTPTALAVAKSAPSVANVAGNQYTATYTVTVSNTGGTAGSYTLSDTPAFASGTTLQSWAVTTAGGQVNSPLPGVAGGGQISTANVPIAAAGNPTATHQYFVAITFTTSQAVTDGACGAPVSANHGLFNTAAIAGSTAASATACGDVPAALNLGVGKQASVSQAANGDSFTYTLTATNSGAVATTNPTTIVDTIPTGLTLTAITAGTGFTCTPTSLPLAGDGSTSTVTCTSTTGVAAGTTTPVTVATLAVTKTSTADIVNTARATAGDPACSAQEPAQGCSATVTVTDDSAPVLGVTKTNGADTVTAGAAVTYTVTITNTGTAPATGVSWTDTPTGLSVTGIANGTASAGSVFGACTSTGCTGATVAPDGGSVSYLVTAQVTGSVGQDAVNTATVTGTGCPTTEGGCTATDTDRIQAVAVVAPIPTLGEWGVLLLSVLLGLLAWRGRGVHRPA